MHALYEQILKGFGVIMPELAKGLFYYVLWLRQQQMWTRLHEQC